MTYNVFSGTLNPTHSHSGIKYPVAFASRKLLTRESIFNYSKRMFSHCVGSAKVSELSAWEVFHFGDRPSGIVVFGQSSV